ncbi:MAG: YdcF family protein [Paramuribaculum sp.]|nr:YdcF family protein [Paramuribaculum sp.]
MKKKFIISILSFFVLLGSIVLGCNLAVSYNGKGRVFDAAKDMTHNTYGVLLATSPITPDGGHNFYFDNRIIAADSLFKLGRIDYIIASGGDYRTKHKFGCDEPKAIRDSLVARGVPAERIILDYEGTRTFNSIYKAKKNGLNHLTFISQRDHNERALRIADHLGINAIAYNAKPSHIRKTRIKNTLREYLARVKMYMDFVDCAYPTVSAYENRTACDKPE